MSLHRALSANKMGLKMLGLGLRLGGWRVGLSCLFLHCCVSPGFQNHVSFLIIPFRVLPLLPFTLFLDFYSYIWKGEEGKNESKPSGPNEEPLVVVVSHSILNVSWHFI